MRRARRTTTAALFRRYLGFTTGSTRRSSLDLLPDPPQLARVVALGGSRIPFVQQMEAVECGAACLTMALRSFGHHAELSELREACGVSRDGVSAKSVVRVARQYGLSPRARRLEPADLAEVKTPAVLHWEMNHFVLLERITPEAVHLVDPAVGPRTVSSEDFDRSFTGICIELEPGEEFRKKPPERRAARRYLELLKHARLPLLVVAGSSLVINVLGLAVPITTQLVVDRVLAEGQHRWLEVVGIAALALLVLQLSTALLRGHLLSRLRIYLDGTLTTALVRHLMSLPLRFFMQRHTGDLAGRVASMRRLRELLAGPSVALLVDGVLLLGYLALMLLYEARLGLVVLVAALAYGGLYAFTRPAQLGRYRERVIKDVKQDVQLLQTVQGVVTLKGAGREAVAHARWLHLLFAALNARARETHLADTVGAVLFAVRLAAPAIVLVWGAKLVVAGELTLGMLLGFLLVAAMFLGPLERVVQTLLELAQLPVHLARLDDVLSAEPEGSGKTRAPRLEGAVTFDDVTFRYGPTSPAVLDGVSLSIARGEKVAVVGRSGSGKSTVARLLLGLVEPESGRILVDDRDLATLDVDSVRRQIGAVLQESQLFDGTVRQNVALYDPSARLEEVAAACRVAQIHEDIEALPRGYDTPVGSGGGPLSGGQRQRLALARAVLHRPAILVLDEATSALDALTESAIERYLASRTCTRIVIAHRLSTVRDADRILVLDRGRIVEQGRHEELLAEGGLYAELVRHGQHGATAAPRAEIESERVQASDLDRFSELDSLDAEDKAALAARLRRRSFVPGAALLQQGTRGAGLFFVEEGTLAVVIEEAGLRPLEVDEIAAGGVLGEVSLLDGSPASATLRAKSAVRALHLPSAEFDELREGRDRLALRLLLALGKLAARRIRETTARRKAVGLSGGFEGQRDEEPAAPERAERRRAALRIEDTALGGALTDRELADLDALGREELYEAGAPIFEKGDRGDGSYVVLSGRIAVTLEGVEGWLNVVKVGELFGEVGLFDEGDRTAGCVAVEPSTLFRIDHARLHALLESGSGAAWKVLRHLTYNLVRVLRISTLRLREAIAEKSGEQDTALAAREQARALSRSRDLSMLVESDGRVPVVEHPDPELSGAACLTAVLRYYKKAVPFVAVAETASEGGSIHGGSLMRAARSFGLLARRLVLDARDFPFVDAPLLLRDEEGRYVVAERYRRGRMQVMDPLSGRRELDVAELDRRYAGECFEVRREEGGESAQTLGARVRAALSARRRALGPILLSSAVLQAATLVFPLATGLVVGAVIPSSDLGLLAALAPALALVVVVSGIAAYERARALSYFSTHVDRSLTDQLVRHVLSLPISFFERVSTGRILERFEALRALRDGLGGDGLRALLDLPLVLAGLLIVAWLEPRLFVLLLGALALHTLLVLVALSRLRRRAAEQLEAASETKSRLIEAIAGVATLRVAGDKDAGPARWLPAFVRELRADSAQDRALAVLLALVDALRFATLAVAVWWGALAVLAGELGLGALIAAQSAIAAVGVGVHGATRRLLAYARSEQRIDELRSTFALEPEQRPEGKAPPGRLRGRVRLDGVSFSYEVGGAPVVRDVSLDIEPGSKVAIVGASGSGKSTLGKLLLGFYLPSSGRILLDGKDLAGLELGAVRAQMGVVLQESFLFAGTVRENLSINAPGSELEPIMRAARRAAIHADVARLPMQYDTLVSEGGSSFSGGQRQRLALARALVHEPAILLLDEATSALDNESQAAVEQNLASLSCTRVVIAHRLSTVIDADHIVVLERGRVVEQGTHEALLAARGRYWELVRAQLG